MARAEAARSSCCARDFSTEKGVAATASSLSSVARSRMHRLGSAPSMVGGAEHGVGLPPAARPSPSFSYLEIDKEFMGTGSIEQVTRQICWLRPPLCPALVDPWGMEWPITSIALQNQTEVMVKRSWLRRYRSDHVASDMGKAMAMQLVEKGSPMDTRQWARHVVAAPAITMLRKRCEVVAGNSEIHCIFQTCSASIEQVHDCHAAEAPGHRGDSQSGQLVCLQPPHKWKVYLLWASGILLAFLRCHEAQLHDPAGTEAAPPASAPGSCTQTHEEM